VGVEIHVPVQAGQTDALIAHPFGELWEVGVRRHQANLETYTL
jgi:hypothetical protein